ncbi:hypothetical protein Tco_0008443 [Tanacetum coccineum]
MKVLAFLSTSFHCPKSGVHLWIGPVVPEFLDAIVQCFINLMQSAITELVYFIEPHDHLNPVSISKDDCLWRVYDGEIMLELKSVPPIEMRNTINVESFVLWEHRVRRYLKHSCNYTCIPLQSRTDQARVAPSRHQGNMPPSSLRLTRPWKWLADVVPEDCIIHLISEEFVALFHLELEMNHVRMKHFNNFECRPSSLEDQFRSDEMEKSKGALTRLSVVVQAEYSAEAAALEQLERGGLVD